MKEMAKKILVVDDEPDLRPLVMQRMRRDIRRGKYEFHFAGNGIEAIDVLSEISDIDMIITDINMPGMDGLALLEKIPDVNPNTRAIVVSAYGDMNNIRTAMNRGAFDFVTKPIDFGDLRVTIERTLRNLQEWREAMSSRDKLTALESELDVANQIQQSILPTEFPKHEGFRIFGSMEPAKEVGGDFFDLVLLEDRCVGLSVADVSDKGVPAALFMMSSRTMMKGAAISARDPGEVLGIVNSMLAEDNDPQMFVTVLYAVYDPENGQFTYASGGHDAPLVVHEDGSSELLDLTSGLVLGIVPDIEFEQNSVTLNPGDTVICYTDGVTEAMNSEGEQFGIKRLMQTFVDHPPINAQDAVEKIFNAVSSFADGTVQSDDITCLTLSRDVLTPDE
ncbi:MAG: SpoIIE family protein phosphatase [Chloroflexi bacterium]|nr:SpoIIE family protein phosphatase [Chloroflexota bacterium]